MLSSSDDKYVNAIRLCEKAQSAGLDQESEGSAAESQPVAELLGNDYDGHWHSFELQPGEQILGVYGSLNSAPNIRGLGFIVWKAIV